MTDDCHSWCHLDSSPPIISGVPASDSYYSRSLTIGDVFADDFEILDEIGQSRLGTRYLAHSTQWDRRVVLQPFEQGLDSGGEARHVLADEWETLGRLREPSITGIVELGETADGTMYAATEHLDGESLEARLAKYGAHAPKHALAFGNQIARGIAAAHNQGILHRNLQPDDITLASVHTDRETAHVAGFGTVRLLGSYGSDLTRGVGHADLELYGSLRFLSPELVRGRGIDERSDLYAFGLILYEMLVGTPAIKGQSPREILGTHAAPQPLEFGNLTALEPELRSIIRRCTKKSPGDRFQSFDILLRKIEEAQDIIGRPSESAPTPGREGPPQKEVVRNYESQLDEIEDSARPNASSSNARSRQDSVTRGAPAVPDRSDSPAAEAATASESPRRRTESSEAQKAIGRDDTSSASSESGVLASVWGGIRLLLCAAFMGGGYYAAFMVLGALLGPLFDDPTSRLSIALFMTSILPLVGIVREMTTRERFREAFGLHRRIERAMLVVGLLTTGTALFACLALPGLIIDEIRSNPNWFVDTEPMVRWNRTASGLLARSIESGTQTIGIYRPPEPSAPPPTSRERAEVPTYSATEDIPPPTTRRDTEVTSPSDTGVDVGIRRPNARDAPASETTTRPSPSSESEPSSESPVPPSRSDDEESSGSGRERDETYQRWESGSN